MTIRNTLTETGFGTVLGALTFRGEPGAKSGALSWRRQGDGHLGLDSPILGEAMARIRTAALAFAIAAALVFAAGAVLMPRP